MSNIAQFFDDAVHNFIFAELTNQGNDQANQQVNNRFHFDWKLEKLALA